MSNETMRIFFQLKIFTYPQYDCSEDERENISPRKAVAYENQILAAIAKENRHFENDRGLAEYMHDEALKEKVYSLYPSVEIVDGELWGVMTAGLKEPLSGKETAVLLSFVEGQNADGYGEGFEQRPIKTPDGEVYVSFWDRGKRISRDLIVSHSVKIRYPFSDSGFLLSFAYVHTAWLSGSIKTALRSA